MPASAVRLETRGSNSWESLAAAEKAFKDLYSKFPGTAEATVAASYLGALSMDQNKLADAEKYFQQVVNAGDRNYASMGKMSLAQVYLSTGRNAEAEKLLEKWKI